MKGVKRNLLNFNMIRFFSVSRVYLVFHIFFVQKEGVSPS